MLAGCVAVSVPACRDLTIAADRVIAIEVTTAAPKVAVGDTLRLSARALNGAGAVVPNAAVAWVATDTAVGFSLNGTTGLVTGISAGSWHVQARVENLRSDPITVTVIAAPGSPSSSRASERSGGGKGSPR